MMIKVTGVKPLPDFQLELSFNTGETRVFDVGPYLGKGIFTDLRDPTYFQSVRLAFGSIAWPNGQDFGPESLYVESRTLVPAGGRRLRNLKRDVGRGAHQFRADDCLFVFPS